MHKHMAAAIHELAHKAADESARGFKCGKDEVKAIGTAGRAAGDAALT